MVNDFGLLRTPKIIFGEGKINDPFLPDVIHGKSVLVITGRQSWSANSLEQVFANIEKHAEKLLRSVIGNEPTPYDIDAITEKYRSEQPDIIIAIGGGSAIDAGKAVSAMLHIGDSVKEYLEGIGSKKHDGQKVLFIAIPTTSGTGSEATSNSVIAETGKNGYKRSLRHDNFVPDIALVDPGLTISCPPHLTAATGLDALTQLIESYVSVKASALTDSMAISGISNAYNQLMNAYEDGSNIAARKSMSYAALLSGITLSNAGLGLVHGLAPVIGSMHEMPHGAVCGSIMGIVNRYNIEALIKQKEHTPAHMKYAKLGEIFSGTEGRSLNWYMSYAADYIDDLVEKLKIPALGEYGITESDLEVIAEKAGHKANPVHFNKEEIMAMLRKRL